MVQVRHFQIMSFLEYLKKYFFCYITSFLIVKKTNWEAKGTLAKAVFVPQGQRRSITQAKQGPNSRPNIVLGDPRRSC